MTQIDRCEELRKASAAHALAATQAASRAWFKVADMNAWREALTAARAAEQAFVDCMAAAESTEQDPPEGYGDYRGVWEWRLAARAGHNATVAWQDVQRPAEVLAQWDVALITEEELRDVKVRRAACAAGAAKCHARVTDCLNRSRESMRPAEWRA